MCLNKEKEAENNARKLRESDFVWRVRRLYPLDIFSEKESIHAILSLLDEKKELVVATEFLADYRGLMTLEQSLDHTIDHFEIGLYNRNWDKSSRQIRKLKF